VFLHAGHLVHDRNAVVRAGAEEAARVVEQHRPVRPDEVRKRKEQAQQPEGHDEDADEAEQHCAHGSRLYRHRDTPARSTRPPSPDDSADASVADTSP